MKNLFARTLATALFIMVAALQLIAQEKFAYQAVIRDSEGNLVTQGKVGMKFSLTNAGKTYYVETQTATPNQYGNVSVIIGDDKNKVSGSMADVPWSTLDITMKVEVDVAGGTNYKLLGETKLAPAPYALYAPNAGGVATVSSATKDGATLFEVNDRNGNPVFAVTDNGIVVYVDDTDSGKVRRSGFYITGRDSKDGESNDYFSVTTEGTQVFVDGDDSKVRRSGFYITGRDSKSGQDDYLTVDGKGTTVYVDANGEDKVRRSGFYITGRDSDKSADNDMFAVEDGQTTVYVDDLGDGKVRRSGFLIVGRDSKDGKIIDIDGSHTELVTTTLSIASAGASEDDAPVSALQITSDNVTMNSDMVLDGGVRPILDEEEIEEIEEYNVWLSDSETNDALDEYNYASSSGRFNFLNPYYSYYYYWLAAFHDTRVVPVSSMESMLMFNRDGEETAIVEDAVVAVLLQYGGYFISVWPLEALSDFKFSFAMCDYYPTSFIGGYASEYARINVTLNSSKPYAGCEVGVTGNAVYTAKITTDDQVIEQFVSGGSTSVTAVLGKIITLEATDIPIDRVFSHWLVNGHRYDGNPANMLITSTTTTIEAVFKDESQVIYVDGEFASPVEPTAPIGSEENPYTTFAQALKYIADNGKDNIGYRISANNINEGRSHIMKIGADCNGKVKYISIEFMHQYQSHCQMSQIVDSSSVPVIIRNVYAHPDDPNGDDVVKVVEPSAKLTLENSEINGSNVNGTPKKIMHGAVVSAGELILVNTGLTAFTIKSSAVVENGATLTFKGNGSIRYNGYYVKTGCAVYLKEGSTLNVLGGRFWGNMGYTQSSYPGGHTEGFAGSSIYAEKNTNFNVYVSDNLEIDGVGLAKGAYITVIGEQTPAATGYGYGNGRNSVLVYFDSIADPNDVIVKLADGIDQSRKADIFSRFVVDNQSIDALGYKREIGPEGKLVKSNAIWAKGSIALNFKKNEERGNDNISYTYYRNESGNEYLYLKDTWNNGAYGYRNYWLVNGQIFTDTMYCYSGGPTVAYPIYDFKGNFGGNFSDCSWQWDNEQYSWAGIGNLFNVANVATSSLQQKDNNGVTQYYVTKQGEDVVCMEAVNGVVTSLTDADIFKANFTTFKSLIEPLIGVRGRGFNLENDLQSIEWTNNYTVLGLTLSSGKIVDKENGENGIYFEGTYHVAENEKDVIKYNYEHRRQVYQDNYNREIDNMFDKLLANSFLVSITASASGSVQVNGETTSEYEGNSQYGQTITLKAIPDEGCEFIGWSDGNTDLERTIMVTNNITMKANFTKVFYVSSEADDTQLGLEDHPFASLAQAEEQMTELINYKVYISGEIYGSTQINGRYDNNGVNKNVTLEGFGDGATLKYDVDYQTNVLELINDVYVTVRNLRITGADRGIFMNNAKLTLEDNVVIDENVNGVYLYVGNVSNVVYVKQGTEIRNNQTGLCYRAGSNNRVYVEGGTIAGNTETDIFFENGNYTSQGFQRSPLNLYANSTVNTIYLGSDNSTLQQITVLGSISNSSDNPITIKFKNFGSWNSGSGKYNYVDVTDLSYIEDKQLLNSINFDIATELKKFRLDNHDYCIDADGYVRSNYVDLDLEDGTLWAKCNVGTSWPEEYGDYFAWGETSKKENYVTSGYSQPSAITTANDAATQNWGDGWQMPSKDQFDKLISGCYWEWKENYNGTGKNGFVGTSKNNGAKIFFPATGAVSGGNNNNESATGSYWSTGIGGDGPYILNFGYTSEMPSVLSTTAHIGRSVRPVKKQN